MAKIFNAEFDIVPEHEVIRQIVTNPKLYTLWTGAGTSIEAGIPGANQICEYLRKLLADFAKPIDEEIWAQTELNWDDRERRYSTCLKKYGGDAIRVRYFRELIQGRNPVFGHHAISLLMQYGFFKNTCLTTNFDKLLEIAFAQQGSSECQPIRGNEEACFLSPEEDKFYVIKLHGDYDTHNILNTNDETVKIPSQLRDIAVSLMQRSGLVVVGGSGYEDSVIGFFNDLPDDDRTILNMGLYWGVYVSGDKEADPAAMERKVLDSIRQNVVSKKIVELMARKKKKNVPCAFFPIWGAGNFFFELVQWTKSRAVIGKAERYLDHKMRLQHKFSGHLAASAIQTRLARLDAKEQERTRGRDLDARTQVATYVWRVAGQRSKLSVDVLYGDITSRTLMDSGDPVLRSAVISPDDTFISASGGAALALLQKAGQHAVLNELSKFSSIEQEEVVVTSGGELPVNYIFHAAATLLREDGTAEINADNIFRTINNIFEKASSLKVGRLLVPLVGSGEGVKPEDSFEAILRAAKLFSEKEPAAYVQLSIVILDEGILARKDLGACLKKVFDKDFVVVNAAT